MFLIVGLGNPGLKYNHTRHNAGFDVVDLLADKYDIHMGETKMQAKFGTGFIDGQKVILAKPQTYMNNSGDAVAPLLHYYNLDPETELLIISDDIALPTGHLRIRKKGSAGGHNGLKSVIAAAGTENFMRLRIGVGKVPEGGDQIKHVLGHYNAQDKKNVETANQAALEAIPMIVAGQIDLAMSRYNGSVLKEN